MGSTGAPAGRVLDPEVAEAIPAERRQSAASRAAQRSKAASSIKTDAFGLTGNANGLQGRGKGRAGGGGIEAKPKHYSKKNKRGTSHYED